MTRDEQIAIAAKDPAINRWNKYDHKNFYGMSEASLNDAFASGFKAGANWEQSRSKWISPCDELPPIDESDGWSSEKEISVEVWTISSWGMRIGRYSHASGNWLIDGIYSGKKILVTFWQSIPEPPVE